MNIKRKQMNFKVGIFYTLLSGALFASYTGYVQLLDNFSSFTVVGHRVIWALSLILILLTVTGQLKALLSPLKKLSHWPDLIIGALLIAPQYWIFAWAPVNGYILDFALAYFLLPLILVFIGCVFFGERLSFLRGMAVMMAAFGVAHAFIYNDGVSWVVPWCSIGMTLYCLHKKRQKLPMLSIFVAENLILLPAALIAVVVFSDASHPLDFTLRELALFIGAGFIASAAFVLWLEACRLLPLALFGILNYSEPVMIFFIGLLLGGSINLPVTYWAIFVALLLSMMDGIFVLIRSRQNNFPKAMP